MRYGELTEKDHGYDAEAFGPCKRAIKESYRRACRLYTWGMSLG